MPGCGDCNPRRCRMPRSCWTGGTPQCASNTQAARGVGAADAHLAAEAVRGLERAKWRSWHGRWPGCRRKLAALCRWARRTSFRGLAGIGRLERHVSELLAYLERNQRALVHYAARRRNCEPISTAFVESSVNEIIAKRMNKNSRCVGTERPCSPSSTYEQRC
jgi:hypothetical protein